MRFPVVFISTLLARLTLAGSVFFALPVCAQLTSEVGAGIGGMAYRGDIAPRYRVLNNRPAGTVFYKRDTSPGLTLRAGLTIGLLQAVDGQVERGGDVVPISASRSGVFRATLAEILLGVEYNFLDYYDQKRRTRWTPYFFTGVAGYYASTSTEIRVAGSATQPVTSKTAARKISVALPLGLGIKYALSREFNLIVEAGGRRTFGDNFDNIVEAAPPQLADQGGPDWYFYNGISLSYTFYKILCPAGHPGIRRAR